MPVAKLNIRQERFCLGLAEGETQDAAYAAAGYKPHRPSASRLRSNANVQARMSELLGEAAGRTLVTIENIAAQLDEDRQLAFSQGQAGAAVSASLAKARLFGLLVDRAEVETIVRKPMREAVEDRQMSLQEWERRFKPKTSPTQPG